MIVQKGNGIRYCICGKSQYSTFEEVVFFFFFLRTQAILRRFSLSESLVSWPESLPQTTALYSSNSRQNLETRRTTMLRQDIYISIEYFKLGHENYLYWSISSAVAIDSWKAGHVVNE